MPPKAAILIALPALSAASLQAEDHYNRHNFSFAIGAARPRGDLGSFLNDSPGISAGYGYRFQRYFQADAGLDVLFGAANVRDFLRTGIGDLLIRDREFLVPLGGRAIMPLLRGRVLLSGGGGGVYMRYSELLRQPSQYFRVDCSVCTSRGGWGYYALLGTSFALDRYQHFRLGALGKFYRGHTNGDPIGAVPGLRTKDHWINLFGEFGFSF